MSDAYEDPNLTRAEVDALSGAVVLEFGADWCPICQAAQPHIAEALADGKGKPLGRSFAVKLWPTLVFLKDGAEVAREVRPTSADDVRRGLAALW
jgi:thioredoxin 1